MPLVSVILGVVLLLILMMRFNFSAFTSLIISSLTVGMLEGMTPLEATKAVEKGLGNSAGSLMLVIIFGAAVGKLLTDTGGAFKEVLIESHIDKYVSGLMANMPLSPLLLTWVIALVLRISLGSATVASMTAASIAAPLVHVAHISPELMTLAAGAGSIGLSHVNDAGFWIVKEYFNMSMKKTFSTWTVLTTIIAVVGLLGVLVLDIFL